MQGRSVHDADSNRAAKPGPVAERGCQPTARPKHVSRDWHKDALQDAALRDMPLHALRRTSAAAWLAAGNSLMYVQRQLGNLDIGTTERYYGHRERHVLAGRGKRDGRRVVDRAIKTAGWRRLLAVDLAALGQDHATPRVAAVRDHGRPRQHRLNTARFENFFSPLLRVTALQKAPEAPTTLCS